MASLFQLPVTKIKGVGETRAKLYKKLGVASAGALLRFYPRSYEDLSRPLPVMEAPLDTPCAVRATLISSPTETRVRGGMLLTKMQAADDSGVLHITYFNNPYVKASLREGEEYIFYGKITSNFLRREAVSPEWFPADSCPPVRPIYRQTKGLTSRMIQNNVKSALSLLPETMQDPIPENIRLEHGLCHLGFALENIHFPKDMEAANIARRRLIFEELLVLQLALQRMKGRNRRQRGPLFSTDYTGEFCSHLPFSPTGAQKRVIAECAADMGSGLCMNRLVQGDVGSGKTAVAAALCFTAAKNGFQAAMMAPTEILAKQHYATFSSFLEGTGVTIALLTGSTPAAQKRTVLTGLRDGSIQLAVGTHALLSEGVEFSKLGLVITDEQHRFGVEQREALAEKGDSPHLLVMSATPIPRTLALMIYGDLDLSVLDELPPGRTPVATYSINSEKRARAFAFLKKHVEQGLQCYIICPMIEEGVNDMKSVSSYAKELREEWLPGCRIGELHGKLPAREKERIMEEFAQGKLDILVSTTVVEVGMDVPNAAVMMIENAERYGLSQLHQLRGRVGRGKAASTCILVTDAQNEETLTRMKVMCSTNNGFRIADEDLKLRGPGDFFGSRQHGLPELKIADMLSDTELLGQTQAVAKSILKEDFSLEKQEHRGLRGEVRLLLSTLRGA